MNTPCEPGATPDLDKQSPEILLRLGDILHRVPADLLKPGPHDTKAPIRLRVDYLEDKIARGRVTVPLRHIATACPEVFSNAEAIRDGQEILLPMQKLLVQVSHGEPKVFPQNGTEKDPNAAAQGEFMPILGTVAAGAPAAPGEGTQQLPARFAKAITSARQVFGLLKRSDSKTPPVSPEPKQPKDKRQKRENQFTPPDSTQSMGRPAAAAPEAATPPAPAEPPAPAVPADCISLHLLPIFRLLPADIVRRAPTPSAATRLILPLATIDPQLATGHVEIPIEDFVKALPEEIRAGINAVPGAQVWIPLDEVFQGLPPSHPFYMPPFDEPAPAVQPVSAAPAARIVATAAPAASPTETPAAASLPKPISPMNDIQLEFPKSVAQTEPPAQGASGPAEAVQPVAAPDSSPTGSSTTRAPWRHGFQVPPPPLFAEKSAADEPAQQAAPPKPTSAEAAAAAAPVAEPIAEPDPAIKASETAAAIPAVAAPPQANTQEARRTADYLSRQPGIFAAAAFVQGATFASPDFPRKPDLDTLRDFISGIVEQARENGRRLGWNRALTIACEQFHATAIVRETHFIVVLHRERLLPSPVYNKVLTAAEDLSKAMA